MAAPIAEKALNAITKWSRRPEWEERFAAVVESHMVPTARDYELDPEELADVLGPDLHALLGTCMFEDFVSTVFEPDDANVIQDYLRRRGWKEPAPVRRYLEALRDSVMSLWEIVDTAPGSHVMVRDLLRGGGPVRIDDKHTAKTLERGDRMAARLLPVGGKTVMSAGVLPLPSDEADHIVDEIRESLTRRLAGKGAARNRIEAAALRDAPAVLIRAWLAHVLDEILREGMPELMTRDGETVVICHTRFPIADPARVPEIADRLDRHPDLERSDSFERPSWAWTPPGDLPPLPEDAVPLVPDAGEAFGAPLLGIVQLEDDALVLNTNAVERCERGCALLAEALDGLIGEPTTTTETAEQVLAELAATEFGKNAPAPPRGPATGREAPWQAPFGELQDRLFRLVLDKPLDTFGGRSPRAVAQTASGRRRVAAWLKEFEHNNAQEVAAGRLPPYDSTWMWEELGLTDLKD